MAHLQWQLPIRLHRQLWATTKLAKHQIEEAIAAGRVALKNGNDIRRDLLPTSFVFPEDEVFLDRNPLPTNLQRAGVWALYKPKDMLGVRKRGEHMTGWLDNLEPEFRLNLIGRLARNESGLILATCDGLLTAAINDPGKVVRRSIYIGRPTARTVTTRNVKNILNGIHLQSSGIYKKVKASYVNVIKMEKKDTFNQWTIVMDLREGGHKVGFQLLKRSGVYVDECIRTRVGNINLEKLELKPGGQKKLTEGQIQGLWAHCGGRKQAYIAQCDRLLKKGEENFDDRLRQWCEKTLERCSSSANVPEFIENREIDLSYLSEADYLKPNAGEMSVQLLEKIDAMYSNR